MPPALLRFSALRAEDRRLRSFSDTIGKNRTPDTARSDVAVTVSHSNCRALDAADTPNANLDPLQGLSESERKTARTFQKLAMCSLGYKRLSTASVCTGGTRTQLQTQNTRARRRLPV